MQANWFLLLTLTAVVCSFSGSRLHQGRIPRPRSSDVSCGGGGGTSVLAAEQSVWATGGWNILARTHPNTPSVQREARRWRVSIHRVGTLRGSLVGVCPAIQRLPVRLPDRSGVASEFLWFPFGLSCCNTAEPCRSYPQTFSPLAPCNVSMAKKDWAIKVSSSISSRDGTTEWLVEETHLDEAEQGQTAGPPALVPLEAQKAPAFVSLPIAALTPGRVERGWVADLPLCFSPHQPLFSSLALCDNCPLNWCGRGDVTRVIYNRQFVSVNGFAHIWLWSYVYPESSVLKILFALYINTTQDLCMKFMYVVEDDDAYNAK